MLIDFAVWTLARSMSRRSDGAPVRLYRARGGARLLLIGEGREHFYRVGDADRAAARFEREVGQ